MNEWIAEQLCAKNLLKVPIHSNCLGRGSKTHSPRYRPSALTNRPPCHTIGYCATLYLSFIANERGSINARCMSEDPTMRSWPKWSAGSKFFIRIILGMKQWLCSKNLKKILKKCLLLQGISDHFLQIVSCDKCLEMLRFHFYICFPYADTKSLKKNPQMLIYVLQQCFPTFFQPRHTYLEPLTR